MKRRLTQTWKLLAAGCLLACLGFLPHGVHGQKPAKQRDKLFSGTEDLRLEIDIEKKQLEALRREPRKYAKATLKEGDKVYKDVAIHVKGAAGSFRGIDDKPSLTINMDKFEEEELFHGMDKFHLANSLQDPSYISELLCGELFRAAGVPASRITYAVVKINGRSRGLYYLKEGYDKYFLKQAFGNRDGNLYDGGFLREIDQPLQLLHTREDVKVHTDLKALVAASREPDVKQRFAKMDKVLDMDKFISFLALEVITWDWDGYPMNRNNYRVYHDPARDKIIIFPSGMDQMFGDPNGPLTPGFQGLVARKLMETPEGRKLYLARMDELLKTVFRFEVLNKRLEELQARVQPALASVDAGAGRDYPNQINRLRQAMRQREKSLQNQLKQIKK